MRLSRCAAAAVALATAGTAAYSVYRLAVRSYVTNWGATADETERAMPGDDILPNPKVNLTHAITIEAPAAAVWPWLLQIGSGRAGWYSYDQVDNAGQPSARRILPEYQHLQVGDGVPMVADGSMSMPVVSLEPERCLVLGGNINTQTGAALATGEPLPENYFSGTMSFVLDEVGVGTTRLIVRARLGWGGKFFTAGMYVLEPGTFVMNRKMLLGIKERVEAGAA